MDGKTRTAWATGFMLGFVAGVVLVGLVWVFADRASAQVVGGPGTVDTTTPLTCDNKALSFHRHRARAILRHEYRVTYYSTHETADRAKIDGYQEHKRCIRHRGIRRDLGKQRKQLARFQRQRIAATPYPGYGVYWPIPAYIASCESGGGGMPDYYPSSGLTFGGGFGLLVSTWQQFGGGAYASQANYAEPWQQDLIAHRVWSAVGPGAWACA